jgi:hypothetical protein
LLIIIDYKFSDELFVADNDAVGVRGDGHGEEVQEVRRVLGGDESD